MNRKTEKLLVFGAVGALVWYVYNKSQQVQVLAAQNAARAAAGQPPSNLTLSQ